jgi:hypothetical protein
MKLHGPRPAVLRWLQDEGRCLRETPKASKQQWVMTVFEATEGDSEPQLKQKDKPVLGKFQLFHLFNVNCKLDKIAVYETGSKKVVRVKVKILKFGTHRLYYTHDK